MTDSQPVAQRTASEKQIAANQLNSTHSTGPRTPEGKARSLQQSSAWDV